MNNGVLQKPKTLFPIPFAPTAPLHHPNKIHLSFFSIQPPKLHLLSFHIKLPSAYPVFASRTPVKGEISMPGTENFDFEDEFEGEFEEEDEDEDEEEDEGIVVPLRNMREWTQNKPRGFGEGKVYDTSIEDKLMEELEQSRVAQLANVTNLKNNPEDGNPKGKLPKQKVNEVAPNGVRVRLVHLPKKKNIHRDLQAAFKPFVNTFSTQPIAFGKVQKQIKCEIMKSSSPNPVLIKPSVHKTGNPLPISDPVTEIPLDPYVEDAAFDKFSNGDDTRDDDLVSITNDEDDEKPKNHDDVVQEKQEPETGSEPSKKPKKVREKGKKVMTAKRKGENTPKLNIPGSANRLKMKEKALLSGVFSKYGGKSAMAVAKGTEVVADQRTATILSLRPPSPVAHRCFPLPPSSVASRAPLLSSPPSSVSRASLPSSFPSEDAGNELSRPTCFPSSIWIVLSIPIETGRLARKRTVDLTFSSNLEIVESRPRTSSLVKNTRNCKWVCGSDGSSRNCNKSQSNGAIIWENLEKIWRTMNSLFARTTGPIVRFSFCGVTNFTSRRRFDRVALGSIQNYELISTRFRARCFCSVETAGVVKSKRRKKVCKPAAIVEEEKNAFFVVRKGDLVGVYNNLIDCQNQVGSSVCDPPVSVYKGCTMPKEAEEYLVSCGLKDALYSIRAKDWREELFGRLVPCPFQRACILEFDGACKGNPGQSGAGAVLRTADGSLFCRLREGLGIATNNVAEYRAMILGLRYALSKGFTTKHDCTKKKAYLVQIQGLWRVRHENIIKWYEEAKRLKDQFLFFKINHVLRDLNSDADAQANLAVVLAVGQVQEEEVDQQFGQHGLNGKSKPTVNAVFELNRLPPSTQVSAG
ncbi:hypothetical protein Ccrd_016054 [Cynara cardunculus var. scolymus]|uniref:RNase H type-1 domain-containing protein n=1 Tax=Cynara cardunculus var. scolymus TaxID=59895 RepID=A0A103YAQ4_CYNCS|nr:hypothetical protein Ccrd_016054 [Cynara cardunculus var. scolymus]